MMETVPIRTAHWIRHGFAIPFDFGVELFAFFAQRDNNPDVKRPFVARELTSVPELGFLVRVMVSPPGFQVGAALVRLPRLRPGPGFSPIIPKIKYGVRT